jgi:hypothetical protein
MQRLSPRKKAEEESLEFVESIEGEARFVDIEWLFVGVQEEDFAIWEGDFGKTVSLFEVGVAAV